MMVGSAPQTPRDLALFFSRMDGFCFSCLRSCRTLERLDRKTGQRRDATRAPNQARNGWRPPGRLLVTPPHHLSDGQILSNLWGPPHCFALIWEAESQADYTSSAISLEEVVTVPSRWP